MQLESAEVAAKATASYFKSGNEHHRRLSKLHSVHGKEGDLFAALAATARRASVKEGTDTSNSEITKEQSLEPTGQTTETDGKKGSGAKDEVKPLRHRRLSKLHSSPRHEEDLFANAVAATARRASISVPEEEISGKKDISIEHPMRSIVKPSKDKNEKISKTSSQAKSADDKKGNNHKDDSFANGAVAATARRVSAGSGHVYVKNGDSITKSSHEPVMPTIEENKEVTPSPHDPIAQQFNQVISSLQTQAIDNQPGGIYTLTLTYQQFLDVINENKKLRDALEENTTTRRCSGLIADNTVLDITEVTENSEELVETIIKSVSQILAVSKTSHINEFALDTTSPTKEATFQSDKSDISESSEELSKTEFQSSEVVNDTKSPVPTLDQTIKDKSRESLAKQEIEKESSGLDVPTEALLDIPTYDSDVQLKDACNIPLPVSVTHAVVDEDKQENDVTTTSTVPVTPIIEPKPVRDIPIETLSHIPTEVVSNVCSEYITNIESKALSIILNAPVTDVITDTTTNSISKIAPNVKTEVGAESDADIPAESGNLTEHVVDIEAASDIKHETAADIPNEASAGIQTTDVSTKAVIGNVTKSTVVVHAEARAVVPVPEDSTAATTDVKGGASSEAPVEPVGVIDIQTETAPDIATVAAIEPEASLDDQDKTVVDIPNEPSAVPTETVADVQVKTSAVETEVITETEVTSPSNLLPDTYPDLPPESFTADIQTDVIIETAIDAAADVPTEGPTEVGADDQDQKKSSERLLHSEYINNAHTDADANVATELHIDISGEAAPGAPQIAASEIVEPPVQITVMSDAHDFDLLRALEVGRTEEEVAVEYKYRLTDLEKNEKLAVLTNNIAENSLENLLIEDILSSTTDARLEELPDLSDYATSKEEAVTNDSTQNTKSQDNVGDSKTASTSECRRKNDDGSQVTLEEHLFGVPGGAKDVDASNNGDDVKIDTIQENDKYAPTDSQLNGVIGANGGVSLSQKSIASEKNTEEQFLQTGSSSLLVPDSEKYVTPKKSSSETDAQEDTQGPSSAEEVYNDDKDNMADKTEQGVQYSEMEINCGQLANDTLPATNLCSKESDAQQVQIQTNDDYPLTDSQLNCVIGAYTGTSLSQKSIKNVRASICEGFLTESLLPKRMMAEDDAQKLSPDGTSENTLKP
ncbi:uncharacterized protein [Amphiura filiformis]|uniref:uncharacterized protein n=1 Tax=Amphiura filiformis TaxID=82378 RepID=UPI003B221854